MMESVVQLTAHTYTRFHIYNALYEHTSAESLRTAIWNQSHTPNEVFEAMGDQFLEDLDTEYIPSWKKFAQLAAQRW